MSLYNAIDALTQERKHARDLMQQLHSVIDADIDMLKTQIALLQDRKLELQKSFDEQDRMIGLIIGGASNA